MSGNDNKASLRQASARASISRRSVVLGGLGAVAAPAVLRTLPANAQSKAI